MALHLLLSLIVTIHCYIQSIITTPSVCKSEQAALRALGYTQTSWDNLSGDELQPASSIQRWSALTDNEKAAAAVLGYSQKAWDNESGSEPQPDSWDKSWAELTSCGDGPGLYSVYVFPRRTV